MIYSRHKKSFGLDISDCSLKIIQLDKKRGQIYLSGFVKEKIPVGLIKNGVIQKEKDLVAILKKALTKVQGKSLESKQVVCNLPEENIFIRMVKLPRMKKGELSQAIFWEAEEHIPLGIDRVYLDWQVVPSDKRDDQQIDVLIAAAPKKLVDSYVSFLQGAGLSPIALEPESIAVVRSLLEIDKPKPSLIVDFGANGSSFVIFSSGAVRFSSRVKISGKDLDRAIAEAMRVTGKKATSLKINTGLDCPLKSNKKKTEGDVCKAIKPIIDNLAKQIQDYLNFYHERRDSYGKSEKISQVVLCGGDALLKNLPEYLGEKIKVPVVLGDPFVNILLDKRKNLCSKKGICISRKGSLAYTTVIGLALRQFIKD